MCILEGDGSQSLQPSFRSVLERQLSPLLPLPNAQALQGLQGSQASSRNISGLRQRSSAARALNQGSGHSLNQGLSQSISQSIIQSIDENIDQILGNIESRRQGNSIRMNEHLLSNYELCRLENIRRNAAFMESLGIPGAVFAMQSDQGCHQANSVRRRRRRNIRNDGDDDDRDGDQDGDDRYVVGGNRGNSVVSMRSRSSAVPTRQMPPRAAKEGVKNYYVGDYVGDSD